MAIGRNDPCPCGSGKKYKRCCGVPAPDPLADAARRVRGVQASAELRVNRLIREDLGEDAIDDAWEDFDVSVEGFQERVEASLFLPWMLYDWEPWDPESLAVSASMDRVTPALTAIVRSGVDTSEPWIAYLIAVSITPTSFHDVVACEPGRALTLKDIFLESTATVFDAAASASLRPGDIVYARVVDFGDVSLIIGSGELVIPPSAKGVILDARKQLRPRFRKFTMRRLRKMELDLRSLYFALREQLLHPQRPELCNTDGDPMEFHALTYTVTSVEAAIAALAPLSQDDGAQLLAEANRARPGGSRRVTFSWTVPGNPKHGGMSSTVLADFKISGTTLTVDVNSAQRATRVKAEIAKRLGDQATFVRDDRKSMDEAFAEAATKPETRRERAARLRDEELQVQPAVQAMIAKMTADHYSTWPDVPVPALKGKTPRAAMKTADGRERVEALIVDFERSQDAERVSTPRYDFNQLRAALGLPARNRHPRES